ncbi:2-aminoethanethiol dioxygenase [Ischnura elegans]|uniref:2-aminoethanethiol dioxygenase n=1 Tax=Ischnura elegans TaxID=197161 RepID=UPI001ED898E3|nr:2-aminoethanethiol dioxygenase [Ischnura elegans]
MASAIERLIIQAIRTFSRQKPLSPQSFQNSFSQLKSLADNITAEDVNLHDSLAQYNVIRSSAQGAPVTYIEIFENEDVTVGIFVLKPNTRIPLHNHPYMHGILKVILGTIKIQSYSALPSVQNHTPECLKNNAAGRGDFLFSESLKKQAIVVSKKLPEASSTSSDGACVLTPNESNLHEIRCVDGPSAFLDILAPPYSSQSDESEEVLRVCHYFTEAPRSQIVSDEEFEQKKDHTWLIQIPCPKEFYCDTAEYRGPVINL